jgi:putative transposase
MATLSRAFSRDRKSSACSRASRKSQWKATRTTNAIERLHEEFKRQIKTQTVMPSAQTAAMLFWALLASGQITMRKVDGWESLETHRSNH